MSISPLLQRAQFLATAPNLRVAPPDNGAEVAFAGRSNAGKSSAINALTGQRKLARTSKTPGRTQELVFFALDDDRRLVDLPGYGFAQVPMAVKRQWQHHLEDYLRRRQCLRGLVLLMDIRHPLTEYDRQMLHWCAAAAMPVHCVLTKADKLKRGPAGNTRLKVQKDIAAMALGNAVSVQTLSALKREGLEQLTEVVVGWLAPLAAADATPET